MSKLSCASLCQCNSPYSVEAAIGSPPGTGFHRQQPWDHALLTCLSIRENHPINSCLCSCRVIELRHCRIYVHKPTAYCASCFGPERPSPACYLKSIAPGCRITSVSRGMDIDAHLGHAVTLGDGALGLPVSRFPTFLLARTSRRNSGNFPFTNGVARLWVLFVSQFCVTIDG